MKKCQFCHEEVQDVAQKCRFCGEWLNKKTDLRDKFNAGNEVIEAKSKNKLSAKRWILAIIIFLTIYIPQIIAMKFNTEFAFDYPIGEEYGFAKVIGGFVAAFLIYYFLKSFQINKPLAVAISILSMVPIIRLIIVVGMFFYYKRIDEKLDAKMSIKDSAKDIATLFLGYLAIHIVLIAFSGLYFAPEIMDFYRIIIAIALIYFVSRRKLIFNQKNFALYVVLSVLFSFLIIA